MTFNISEASSSPDSHNANAIASSSQATNTVAPLPHPADEGATQSTTFHTIAIDLVATAPAYTGNSGAQVIALWVHPEYDLMLTTCIHLQDEQMGTIDVPHDLEFPGSEADPDDEDVIMADPFTGSLPESPEAHPEEINVAQQQFNTLLSIAEQFHVQVPPPTNDDEDDEPDFLLGPAIFPSEGDGDDEDNEDDDLAYGTVHSGGKVSLPTRLEFIFDVLNLALQQPTSGGARCRERAAMVEIATLCDWIEIENDSETRDLI